jgi:DNA-binding transcriptional MerR regulator
MSAPLVRIGALSERVGVSPALLRAWERRYGLMQPVRTHGGFRLYSAADEERVRLMRQHLEAGIPAAEAARLTLEASAADANGPLDSEPIQLADELRKALDRLDEPGAHAALDRLLSVFTIETVLRDVVVPYLHELGERWATGDASVAQEHFASNLLRGRLLGLARGWGARSGATTVLACAPSEQHDLPLIAFGLVLAARGRAVTYLGPDTPVATLHDAARELHAQLVVVSATTSERIQAVERDLKELARAVPMALAGAGASESLAQRIGATLLTGDPVTAAENVVSADGRTVPSRPT